MATKNFNELQSQVSGASNQPEPNKQNHSNEVLIGNNEFAQLGLEDGYYLVTNSYSIGFKEGVKRGISDVRNNCIRGAINQLNAIRNTPITLDLESLSDNLPKSPTTPLFKLPQAS
jgi:hypothetical protein